MAEKHATFATGLLRTSGVQAKAVRTRMRHVLIDGVKIMF